MELRVTSIPLSGAVKFYALRTKADIQLRKEIWIGDHTRAPEENCWRLSVLWLTKNETAEILRRHRTRVGIRPEQKTHSPTKTDS